MTKKPKKSPKKVKVVRRKKNTVLMPSPVAPEVQMMVASEFADDDIIERELQGQILPYFIYQYCENKPACKGEELAACKHRKTTGMSVKGVNEVVRRMSKNPKSGSKIRINPQYIKIERDVIYNGEKGVEVSVYAEDLITANSAWGVKFEPYEKVGGRGKYPNTFAVEKALSKAERNAKRKLIPETAATKIIQQLLATPGTVKLLDAPPTEVKTKTVAVPVPSTAEELFDVTMKAIEKTKDLDVLTGIQNRSKDSDKLTQQQKDKIHHAVSVRADQIINPPTV